ncbi:MAG: hypothetical protein SGCHY_001369 [Lobulomycetales sp.]
MQVDQLSTKLEDRENKFFDLEENFNQLTIDNNLTVQELDTLKVEHEESLKTNSNLLTEIRELEAAKDALNTKKENLEQSVAELLQDIRDLKEAHQIELAEKLAELDERVRKELNDLLERTKTELIISYEEKITILKQEVQDSSIAYSNLKADKEAVTTKMHQIRSEMEAKHKVEIVHQHDLWEREKQMAVDDIKSEMIQLNEADREILMQQMEVQKEIQFGIVRQECEEKIAEINEEKAFTERTMRELQNNFNKVLQEKSEAAEAHSMEVEKLKSDLEAEKEESLKKQAHSLNSQMSQLRVQNAIHLNNVEKAHKKEIDDIGVENSTRMAQLRLDMDKVMERAKKLHEVERKVEIEQLNLKFRYDLQEIQIDNEKKTKALIEEIRAEHAILVADAEARSIKEMESKTQEIVRLAALSDDQKQAIAQLELDLKNSQSQGEDYRRRITILEMDVDTEKRTAKRDLEKLEERLKESHATQMESVGEKNLAEAQQMLADFEQGQTFYKNEIAILNKKLKDADIRYQNRESLEADTSLIKSLQDQLKRIQAKCETLKEDANFYKLELTNREYIPSV